MHAARDLLWVGAGLLVHVFGCAASPRGQAVALRDRDSAERFNEQGLALIGQERLSEAEQAFRRAIEADPFCGVPHCNLGLALIQVGKSPFEAAWSFRHATQLMPKAVAPRMGLALIYERAGQLDSAESTLREALQIEPDDIEIVGRLARVHVRQSKLTPETRNWLQSVALNDADPAWRDWAADCLALSFQSASQQGVAP